MSNAAEPEQIDTALFWFLSNYTPLPDGPWFTIGVSAVDGPDLLAPQYWTAGEILEDEFGEVIPEPVRAGLAGSLNARAANWILIFDHHQTDVGLVANRDITTHEVLVELRRISVGIERLRSEIEALNRRPNHSGHNQGPPLDDDIRVNEAFYADLELALQRAHDGVSEGAEGAQKVETERSILQGAMESVGKGLAQETGKHLYDPALSVTISLFHYLHEAISILGRWIIIPLK